MGIKRYTPEQIVAKLRQAEVEFSKGQKTPQVCKKLGVSELFLDPRRHLAGHLEIMVRQNDDELITAVAGEGRFVVGHGSGQEPADLLQDL